MLSPDDKKRLLNNFRSGFPKLKIELLKAMAEVDLLEKDKVKSVLEVFQNRLIIFQGEFLKAIQSNDSTISMQCLGYTDSQVPEIAAGIVASVGTASALTLFTISSTSWFFWTTSSTVAAVVGGALGVSAGVATGGVAILAGVAVIYAVNKLRAPQKRESIRNQILKGWDNEILPQLENWAKVQIDKIG